MQGALLTSPGFLDTTMSAQGIIEKRTTIVADTFLAFIATPLA
jgi:hypothetical protein